MFYNKVPMVPCVVSMETSIYLLLALFKGVTEYLDAGVMAQEKGGGEAEMERFGVGGRLSGA